MIGMYRRWREARRQSVDRQYPHDHLVVVNGLLSSRPARVAASSSTITVAAARVGEERIRAIVREEFARLYADVILARALQGMDES